MSARTPRERAQAIVIEAFGILPDPDTPESAQADFIEERIVSRIAAVLTRAEALAGAAAEAKAEIEYWHPEYLPGGSWYEHPRGSGWARVVAALDAALAGWRVML